MHKIAAQHSAIKTIIISTQHYDIGVGLQGSIATGMQDNGTTLMTCAGNLPLSATPIFGGDGGHVEISKLDSRIIILTRALGGPQRSFDGGQTFTSMTDSLNLASSGYLWQAPLKLWETVDSTGTNMGILAYGHSDRVLVTKDALDSSKIPLWNSIRFLTPRITAIDVSPNGTFYVCTDNGRVFRIDSLPSSTFVTPSQGNAFPIPQGITVTKIFDAGVQGIANRFVTGVAVDPRNSDNVIVTLAQYGESDYVFKSTNANSANPTFTSIQSNLPPMPVYDATIDFYNPNNYILATDMGIWASDDAGQSWLEESNNFPSIPIMKIEQHPLFSDSCQILYILSYGYGIARSTTLASATQSLSCLNNPCPYTTAPEVLAQSKDIKMYPNPASTVLYIEIPNTTNGSQEILISDLSGKIMLSHPLNGSANGRIIEGLNISKLPQGLYLISIVDEGAVVTKKVFVTR